MFFYLLQTITEYSSFDFVVLTPKLAEFMYEQLQGNKSRLSNRNS